MEALTQLVASPLDAAQALLETVLPSGTPSAATAGAGATGPNPTFTDDALSMIVHNLLAGDSRLQGQMLAKFFAPDATYSCNEGTISLTGRDSLAQLLRGVQLLASVEPQVLEITSVADRAVVLLNLSISYKLLPLTWPRALRVRVPATLHFTFAPDTSVLGATEFVITALRQELSLPDLLFWVPGWSWANARLWSPVSGRVLAKVEQLEAPVVGRFQRYLSGGAGYVQAAIWVAQDLANGARSPPTPLAVSTDTPGTAAAAAPPPPPPPSSELLAAAAPDTPPAAGSSGAAAKLSVTPVTAAAPADSQAEAETQPLLAAAEPLASA